MKNTKRTNVLIKASILIGSLFFTPIGNAQNLSFDWAEPNINVFTSSDIEVCGVR